MCKSIFGTTIAFANGSATGTGRCAKCGTAVKQKRDGSYWPHCYACAVALGEQEPSERFKARLAAQTCAMPQCEEPVHNGGLCQRHFQAAMSQYDPQAPASAPAVRLCMNASCLDPALEQQPYCARHLHDHELEVERVAKLREAREFRDAMRAASSTAICAVPGCNEKQAQGHAMCDTHRLGGPLFHCVIPDCDLPRDAGSVLCKPHRLAVGQLASEGPPPAPPSVPASGNPASAAPVATAPAADERDASGTFTSWDLANPRPDVGDYGYCSVCKRKWRYRAKCRCDNTVGAPMSEAERAARRSSASRKARATSRQTLIADVVSQAEASVLDKLASGQAQVGKAEVASRIERSDAQDDDLLDDEQLVEDNDLIGTAPQPDLEEALTRSGVSRDTTDPTDQQTHAVAEELRKLQAERQAPAQAAPPAAAAPAPAQDMGSGLGVAPRPSGPRPTGDPEIDKLTGAAQQPAPAPDAQTQADVREIQKASVQDVRDAEKRTGQKIGNTVAGNHAIAEELRKMQAQAAQARAAVPPAGGIAAPAAPAMPRPVPVPTQPAQQLHQQQQLPAPAAPPAPLPTLIDSEVLDDCRFAASMPGNILLVGRPGVGKTTFPTKLAIEFGARLFSEQMEAGKETSMIIGGLLVDETGTWRKVDGTILEWARHAQKGNLSWLLLDEIPRGNKTVQSDVMSLLNIYDDDALKARGLWDQRPAGQVGPWYIVDSYLTREKLIVSCQYARIWATANLGDRFEGQSLEDEAFRSRWIGGWVRVPDYTPQQLTDILLGRLATEVPGSSKPMREKVIRAMLDTHAQVAEYQAVQNTLLAPLNLRTLIYWGMGVLHLHTVKGVSLQQAFLKMATIKWVEMLIPSRDEETAKEARKALNDIVAKAATKL